jgi:O-antigen biosynthesis protein
MSKLVRRHPEIRFEFRIHEQLLPSIRRLGGEVAWTDIFVVHSGSDPSPAGRAKKYERDLRILEQELADRPDHPFALFNFGMTYSDMGEHARAAEYLERSLQHARPEETQVRKAYALLVHSHDQLGDTHRAAEICRQARELFPDDPELLFRHGKLAHDLGQLDEAVKAYRQLLEEEAERHFSSIDQGIRGYKARHNLALVHQDLQQLELAELEWRLALQADLHFWPAWRALGEQLIRQKRLNTADVLIARLREFPELELQAGLLSAERDRAGGEVEQARRQLEELQERHREAIEPLEALCRLEFEQGTPSAAILALQRLTARRPEDAAAWHNLGAALLREGDLAQARDALSQSLALRPDAPGTLELLKQASEWNSADSSLPLPG